jgi:error-prone DNA polymerase
MQGFRQQFREGALARGVDEETAQSVFDKLLGFAEFGFPKSHSAAFAVLAYQSSWLKKYYPAEFYCALFNAQPMGFYAPHVFTNDAKRHGVSILNPDINLSSTRCSVEDGPEGDAVRVGIGYVRGIGEKAAQAVEEERRRGGPYGSIWELMNRTQLSQTAVENLASVGAFESLSASRRALMWEAGLITRPRDGQMALPLPIEQDMVPLADMTAWERMAAGIDYRVLVTRREDKEVTARLRTSTHTGRPLASDAFLAKVERALGRRLRPLPVGRPRKAKKDNGNR